jgi:MFS family permease
MGRPVNPPARLYTRTFWTACAIHFTGGMSFGMFLLFPLFVQAVGGDALTIGLVLGVGMAVSVAVRPAIGVVLDRLGRRRVLLWGAVANAASYPPFLLLHGDGPALYVLATLHLVVGGALFASYFTYAADLVPPGRRAEGIAIFGVAGMATNGLGPALAEAIIPRAGYPAFFLTATGFALASLALTTRVAVERRGPATGPVETVPHGIVRAVRHGGLLRALIATVLFGAGINAAFYFVAPFTRALGIERTWPFFASYASTTIALRIFGRRMLDRLGTRRVALPAFFVFATGLGTLAALPAPAFLVLAGVACGAGHGTLFPVLQALAVGRTPRALHGRIVSLYTAALDAGAVVGTPLCGALVRAAGYRWMWTCMAASSAVAFALMAGDRTPDRR